MIQIAHHRILKKMSSPQSGCLLQGKVRENLEKSGKKLFLEKSGKTYNGKVRENERPTSVDILSIASWGFIKH